MRIIFVGCGRTKGTTPQPARDLYTGQLTRARAAYADRCREANGIDWWIVSAKYGLVTPNQILRPYDLMLHELPKVEQAAWSLAVVHSLLDVLPDDAVPKSYTIELHMGAEYAKPLARVLQALDFHFHLPVAGKAIGQQIQFYQRAA